MAAKKYLVRQGFVVVLTMTKQDGSTYDRIYDSGEEVTLDDEQAALHIHKLEFANQKDRDAALAAEKQAQVATAAAGTPSELVASLISALQQAMGGAAAPAAPTGA